MSSGATASASSTSPPVPDQVIGSLLFLRNDLFEHALANVSARWPARDVLSLISSLRKFTGDSNRVSKSVWLDFCARSGRRELGEATALSYWHLFTALADTVPDSASSSNSDSFSAAFSPHKNGGKLDPRLLGIGLMCQNFSAYRRTTASADFSRDEGMGSSFQAESPRPSPRGGNSYLSPRGSAREQGERDKVNDELYNYSNSVFWHHSAVGKFSSCPNLSFLLSEISRREKRSLVLSCRDLF